MKIDFIASEQHFSSHLLPIWKNLPLEIRGNFFINSGVRIDIPYLFKKPFNNRQALIRKLHERETNNFILSAGYGEVSKLKEQEFPMILMEHGAGQKYISSHPSYSSGKGGKHNVFLFLSPNEYNAEGHRQNYSDTPVEVIGCPKLDSWSNKENPQNEVPVVCISFHWDCKIVPETRSAWKHYLGAFKQLSESKEFKLIGHGHPRIYGKLRKIYDEYGIEHYQDFADVVEVADVYVCDNSSTLFEFAYLDRPVVVLNAPYYRRKVHHGLRFWEYSDIGFNCDKPEGLKDIILKAIYEDSEKISRRQEVISNVFPYKGNATQVAVDRLANFIEKFPYNGMELKKLLRQKIYMYRHSINPMYARKAKNYMQYVKRSNNVVK